MKKSETTTWPSIEAAYTDEYGHVDVAVYTVAGEIWPQAEPFAQSTLRDGAVGLRLMLRAVAIVSRRRAAADVQIDNLRAYLFRVFKNLILAELKKHNRRREIEEHWDGHLAPLGNPADSVDRKILIEELVSRMDSWTRDVFEWRLLGHSYESIGERLGIEANHVRSAFSKKMARLRKEVS